MQDSVPGPVEVIQLSQKFLIVIVFSHQGISFMKTSYPPPEKGGSRRPPDFAGA